MQQAQETTAKAKAECSRGFHFKTETRIIKAQASHGGTKIFEIGRIDREYSAKHDGLSGFKSTERGLCGALIFCDCITHGGIGNFFNTGR